MIHIVLPHIAFSPDGSQVLGVDGSNIHIYSADDLTEVASIGGFAARLSDMAFSEKGDLFAYKTSGYDALTDLSALSVRARETETFSEVARVTLETDLDELTIPFLRNHIEHYTWNLEINPEVTFSELRINHPSLRCSNPGNYEQRREIIDYITINAPSDTFLQSIWDTHDYPVTMLCLSPDGRTLVSAGRGDNIDASVPPDPKHTLRVWNIKTGEQIALLAEIPPGETFDELVFNTDGCFFAAREYTTITVWDSATWEPGYLIERADARMGLLTTGADMFVSQTSRSDVVFWDRQTGTDLYTLEGNRIDDLLISPDGTLLALKRRNNTIELWGIPAG